MTTNATPVYATFGRRLRALVIDAVVLVGALVAIVLIGDAVRHVPGSGRVLVIAVYGLVLYEPIMVWRYGATIGHRMTNLCVVRNATGGKPGFLRALARFVIKGLLGLPSFVTMATTQRHQAVHDALTHTTVQIRDLALAQPGDFHEARTESTDYVMPSRLRRVIVTLLYCVVLFFAVAVATGFTDHNKLAEQLVGSLWLGMTLLTIIAGWRGQLLGARHSQPPSQP